MTGAPALGFADGVAIATVPPHATAVAVRWLHLVAMAVVVGGAILAWSSTRYTARGDSPMPVVAAYEWLFWAGMGVIVMTGVGNLGALAPHIPDPGVGAGVALAVKLPLVLLAVVGSVPRTIAVVRVRDGSGVETARLEEAYAVTAVGLAVVIGVAVVLAHG